MSMLRRGSGRKKVEDITLSRKVLDWAAERSGQSLRSFGESIAKRQRDQDLIADGKLTVRQAEKLAKAARIPFGFLFLSDPPEIQRAAIPDLRQAKNAIPLSNDFFDVLEDALAKQEWFVEYLKKHGAEPLPFVGRFRIDKKPNSEVVAADIVKELGISDADRRQSTDADAYFSKLSAKAEAKGILVLKSGHVKSFTRRSLSESEFRGFALVDAFAPLVFINGNDAKVAAAFTLMHEVAHIWLGVEGVSDTALGNSNAIEHACNAVAADVLVPVSSFKDNWRGEDDLERVAKFYRVSKLVIARRALDLKLVDQAFYDAVEAASKKIKKKGTPTADLTIPVRNGKRLTKTIVASAMSGETLFRDAATLLNVRPNTVVSLGTPKPKAGKGGVQ